MRSSARIHTARISISAPGAMEHATQILERGGVVVFPTDTVYGVGAHAFLHDGVAQLYAIKARPTQLPIPLLLPDAAAMEQVCADIPPVAWRLAESFWPGGLSLILPRSPVVPDVVTAGGPTVAVRVPDQPFVCQLAQCIGAPLATTSANRHAQPAPVTAAQVELQLGGCVPLILDGGACPGGIASTLVDLTVTPPAIVRPGPISAESLAEVMSVRK